MSLIPEGEYEAECLDLQMGYTATGKEQFAAMFRILGENGRMVKTIQSYRQFSGNSDETTEKMRNQRISELKLMGFNWDTMQLPEKPVRVRVTITHEEDLSGVARERISWINGESRQISQKKPMGEGERLAFAARMRGYAAQAMGDAAEPSKAELAKMPSEPDPWEETNG